MTAESLVFYTRSLYSVTAIFSGTCCILSFPSVAQFPWECQDLNKILKIWRWGSRACQQHDWRVNLVLRSKVYPSKPNRQKRKMLTKPIPRICSPRPLSLTMELAGGTLIITVIKIYFKKGFVWQDVEKWDGPWLVVTSLGKKTLRSAYKRHGGWS